MPTPAHLYLTTFPRGLKSETSGNPEIYAKILNSALFCNEQNTSDDGRIRLIPQARRQRPAKLTRVAGTRAPIQHRASPETGMDRLGERFGHKPIHHLLCRGVEDVIP